MIYIKKTKPISCYKKLKGKVSPANKSGRQMAPSRVARGKSRSSSSSGIFYQGSDEVGNIHMSSSTGNSSNSLPSSMQHNLGQFSGDASNTMLNGAKSSGRSVGESSVVTDANSGLSGGPNLQRSASISTNSYMHLPASPMSFSSNDISISGTSMIDELSAAQQNSCQDLQSQQMQRNQRQRGAYSIASLPAAQIGQGSLLNGHRCIQGLADTSHVHKKPRLNIKQEDIMQEQFVQQLLQKQDSMQSQASKFQLQALVQQQRSRQQHQQLLQSLPPAKPTQMSHQQQLHLRQQHQQQGLQSTSCVKRLSDGGLCSRRLMQYLYHQRQRPANNDIDYWRRFVTEYYSPRAKKRWCISLHHNNGHQSSGVLSEAAVDAWQCDMCDSKSGRGFEATFEVLPRLNKLKFSSGVIDELMFLGLPRESRFPSGIMMLQYDKAVQESVYEQLRVVHEGQLRIIFTADLKILCWEFCVRSHEEFIPRRLVSPQVNQLLQVAQKCQSTIAKTGSSGISQKDLQNNCNILGTVGCQLAKSLEVPSLNDFGFPKAYVQCLQISEVVNSMKDFMDFCLDQKLGPIDGMKKLGGVASPAMLQLQKVREMQPLDGMQGLSTDRNSLSKLVAQHHGLSNQHSNNHHMLQRGALSGSADAAFNFSNYQNQLIRQNSSNSVSNPQQRGQMNQNQLMLSSISNMNQISSPSVLDSSLHNLPVSGFSKSHLLQPQQCLSGKSFLQQNHSQTSQSNEVSQQHMIHQLLQNIDKGKPGGLSQQQCYPNKSENGNDGGDISGFGISNLTARRVHVNNSVCANGPLTTRSENIGGTSNGESSSAGGINVDCQKASESAQNIELSEKLVQEVLNEFTEGGFFGSDLEDGTPFV